MHIFSRFYRDQIQLDECWTVVWMRCKVLFKQRPVMPIFERKKTAECPRSPRHPISIGITLHVYPFRLSRHAVTHIDFFFIRMHRLCFLPNRLLILFGKLFFESDPMRTSVRIICIGDCTNLIRSTETFQSLTPHSIFKLGVVCFFLYGAFTFLMKLNLWFLGCHKVFISCHTLGSYQNTGHL